LSWKICTKNVLPENNICEIKHLLDGLHVVLGPVEEQEGSVAGAGVGDDAVAPANFFSRKQDT
jgi:hypothetical protein